MRDDFAAFILTNGRPDNVKTYLTLRKAGYTGKIYLIVDDQDSTKTQYKEKYGKEVIVFDKDAIARTFDEGDNFNDKRAIIYARNASFEIAENLGIKHFIQLDDDYSSFYYRFDNDMEYSPKGIKRLDVIFESLVCFLINSKASSIAMAQGGDFIGGGQSSFSKSITLKRKAMNSFVCSTDNPFQFVGRINEDVNSYTRLASAGLLLFTTNQVSLSQVSTQSSSGGMTELYLDSGTYVKSFYSVMYHPSSVTIKMMGQSHRRLHHSVNWKNTVPLILRESLKKKGALNG
jgi:hypothetical protein